MVKAIEIARKISSDLEKNWLPELEEYNLKMFKDIFKMNVSIETGNTLVSFIIYSFDPDSLRLDIRKDRYENKYAIMDSVGGDLKDPFITDILQNNNEEFNNIVLLYLEALTNWKWPSIFSLLDYHSSMIRFASQKTETERSFDKMNKEGDVKTLTQDYDIDVLAKVNKQKGDILDAAIAAREKAERLINEIKKEFVTTDSATQSDFGFTFTDTAKEKVDIYSWRAFIRERNKRLKR